VRTAAGWSVDSKNATPHRPQGQLTAFGAGLRGRPERTTVHTKSQSGNRNQRGIPYNQLFFIALSFVSKWNLGAMILLITSSANGPDCARALLSASRLKTEVAPDLHAALNRLREDEYTAVVVDDNVASASASQLEVLFKHLGTAVPVFVNLAISRKDRVVRDVLTALHRVEQEKTLARRSVEWELRSQLKGDLTGILLAAQQALDVPTLPGPAVSKLKNVCELANRMRTRLSSAP